jgi:hypothetical protein
VTTTIDTVYSFPATDETCDSLVYLHANIFIPNRDTLKEALCGGQLDNKYVWDAPSGNSYTFTATGTHFYNDTIFDHQGFDSVVTVLQLTIPVDTIRPYNYSTTPATCFSDEDGTFTLTVSGGTTPYMIELSSNAAPKAGIAANVPVTFTNLPAGTYTATITDASVKQCKNAVTLTVVQPAPLSVSANEVDTVTCAGGADGKAIATADVVTLAAELTHGCQAMLIRLLTATTLKMLLLVHTTCT